MKKLCLVISILLTFLIADAQQHIVLQFSSQDDIPEAVFDDQDSSFSITSKNDELTQLFSKYRITVFEKEYPHAHLVNHPNAEPLDRVYQIETSDDINDLFISLESFENNILGGNIYLLDNPQTLVIPDDYNLLCFTPSCAPRCSDAQNDLINAPAAWNITTGNPAIRIGITDANFLRTQEDLVGKLVNDNASSYYGGFSHGSAVSVLAAGNTNNGVGLASIGYNSKVDLYDYGSTNDILLAAMNGAKIVNCSWYNSCAFVSFDQDMINLIYDTYHTVIIAAAGNGAGTCGAENDVYPASYNHVISVSSVGHYFDRNLIGCGGFSFKDIHDAYGVNSTLVHTHNSNVDLCAPGWYVVIPNTVGNSPNSNYGAGFGTSFAAPMVSGLAALILSVNINLMPDDVEAIMKCTARDLYEIPQNYKYLNKLGSGRIDAGAAVQLSQTWIPNSAVAQQLPPTDIRWFEILNNGSNTIEVESTCSANNIPGYCNIGYRLEAVSSNSNSTIKWLVNYKENSSIVTNSIKYGTSIILTRGIDFPITNVSLADLDIAVRVNDCTPSIYYSEIRNSSCFDNTCSYACPNDIYITGNYTTPITESGSWIKSTGQTTIYPYNSVKLDASPTNGYIDIVPNSNNDFFKVIPTATGVFIAQAFNGCVIGTPSLGQGLITHNASVSRNDKNQEIIDRTKYSIFPNPSKSIFTITHPSNSGNLIVYDLLGKVILQKKLDGKNQTTIDLSKFASGSYIIKLDNNEFFCKIIKY